ncbi:glutathione synthetase [Shewanella pneumatophori]|uniref:glutathione synthase n=1 Tax=Shewanella pneumatophori TaxID=314092 RepID=A0A9X2CGA0_9GAMM|nr:glutathione synthetase [Shewanella pneumatophori]MCL1137210.1 glutathione synthetase [Shewanella pneumatophori]
MINDTSKQASQDAIEWALTHGMALKTTDYSAVHTAFSLTPTPITTARYQKLTASVGLLGKLVHFASEDCEFLTQAIEPITKGDPFFHALLEMYQAIHQTNQQPIQQLTQQAAQSAKRLPLLIMRSDFMDDAALGPKLIEFNGIAAGMGPFGQRIHELHKFLQLQALEAFSEWSTPATGKLVANRALENLAQGVAKATFKINAEFAAVKPDASVLAPIDSTTNAPTFLMVVQAGEDNVYDQHLLEHALQAKGIRTIRRTFRELYGKLKTGDNHRLLLDGVGAIDTVYLRAGYQYCDYHANDIISRVCCDALMQTRIFIEKHRVAVNASVSQQLATSKRVQMLLSSMEPAALTRFGLTLDEAIAVKELLGEMIAVTKDSAAIVANSSNNDWVLKNQGEGGGHCIFGDDILPKLAELKPSEYQAWALMRRLHPTARATTALTVRKGELQQVDDLISEIGMFTVHIDGEAAIEDENSQKQAYAGYLIRSKSARSTEGGVHSGMGVLDSLVFSNK